jgi:hypothetical protein
MNSKKHTSNPFVKGSRRKSRMRRRVETLMGILIGLALVIFLIWYFNLPEETEQEIKRDVSGRTSYEFVRDHGTPSELYSKLLELNAWPKDERIPIIIDFQRKRIEIADRILALENPDESFRVAAARAKLDALGSHYGVDYNDTLNDPAIVQAYRAAIDEFKNDRDEGIAKQALLANGKLTVFEFEKDPESTPKENVEQAILTLVEKYPSDVYVVGTVKLLIKKLIEIDGESGIELTKKVVPGYEGIDDDFIEVAVEQMKDLMILYELNIGDVLTDVDERSADDQNQMSDAALKVLDRDDIGQTSIDLISSLIAWFERHEQYDKSKLLAQKMVDSSANLQGEIGKYAKRLGQDALSRSNLIGTKWNFEALDADRRQLTDAEFSGKVTIVLFWSPRDSRQSQVINDLNNLHRALSNRGLNVVTVSLVPQSEFTTPLNVQPNESWWNLISLPDAKSPYLVQCPITRIPFFLLVDKKGIVTDINVEMSKLKTKVDWLLLDSNQDGETKAASSDGR